MKRPSGLMVCLVAFVLAGCATNAANSPRDTLAQLRRAAEREDWSSVYALLPPTARRTESLEQFRARMRDQGAELKELGTQVGQSVDERRVIQADVSLGATGSVTVRNEGSGWTLPRAGFGTATAASPIEALALYRTALLRQNVGPLLAVLSNRARGSLRSEVAFLIDVLKNPYALNVPLTSTERQLEVKLPDGRSLVLVREEDNWRVDDLH